MQHSDQMVPREFMGTSSVVESRHFNLRCVLAVWQSAVGVLVAVLVERNVVVAVFVCMFQNQTRLPSRWATRPRGPREGFAPLYLLQSELMRVVTCHMGCGNLPILTLFH